MYVLHHKFDVVLGLIAELHSVVSVFLWCIWLIFTEHSLIIPFSKTKPTVITSSKRFNESEKAMQTKIISCYLDNASTHKTVRSLYSLVLKDFYVIDNRFQYCVTGLGLIHFFFFVLILLRITRGARVL